MLDEATARATAIHDGAERRLNLLSTRHAETVRRLTDILDGVQGLVAAEAARMSLEEEVNQSVTKAISLAEAAEAKEADDKDADSDLARLAPPAPETVAAGAVAPPRGGPDGRPAQPGRPAHSPGRHEGPAADSALDGPGGVTGSTPPGPGRVPGGRPAGAPTASSMPVSYTHLTLPTN